MSFISLYPQNNTNGMHNNGYQVKHKNETLLPQLLNYNRNSNHHASTDSSGFANPNNSNSNSSMGFKQFSLKKKVCITPLEMAEVSSSRALLGKYNQDKSLLLNVLLNKESKPSFSMKDDSIFQDRDATEVSPDSSRLMGVRKDPRNGSFLKRSVLGQIEDFTETHQKKISRMRFRSQDGRDDSPGGLKSKVKRFVINKLSPALVGAANFQSMGQQFRLRKNVTIPEDLSIIDLSMDQQPDSKDKRVKVRLRHSDSIRKWGETVSKIRTKINQNTSLIERQSQYTTQSGWGTLENPENKEPDTQSRMNQYFSSFRDMNYHYVSTSTNPYQEIFSINIQKGTSPTRIKRMKQQSCMRTMEANSSMQSFRNNEESGYFNVQPRNQKLKTLISVEK